MTRFLLAFTLSLLASLTLAQDVHLETLDATKYRAKYLRYWFDEDGNSAREEGLGQGRHSIDASMLPEGLHTLHYQVITDDGSIAGTHAVLFLVDMHEQIAAKSLRYWFDDDASSLKTEELGTGMHTIDASSLSNGLHTLHYQAVAEDGSLQGVYSVTFLAEMYKKDDVIAARSLRYWFDGDAGTVKEEEIGTGVHPIDASMLSGGLHTLHYQVITDDGSIAGTHAVLFLADMHEQIAAKSLRYWFDNDASSLKTEDLGTGMHTIDASSLSNGLHCVHYQIIGADGLAYMVQSKVFLMLSEPEALGLNEIVSYEYWVNGNFSDRKKADVTEPSKKILLTALLPLETQPFRSSSFMLDTKGDKLLMYAKNDIHMRFFDALGYWSDDKRSFVDRSVSREVTDVTDLLSTQTFERTTENDVKWFSFYAAPGDTIAFKASQATSIQAFAPSGKEIYAASGDKSVVYGGTHTWEEGTHYLAVHDVMGSKPNITLDYFHMDKYDVVDQDVRIVGNGGCSTITFQGNGFKDLYAVELKDSKGNIIESINVGHESDASTTVTFDFTDTRLGMYNAVFHFTEEDKVVANCITVEEAIEIELATKVTYPSTFLRGTSVTYTVEITNKGNMTAYEVPIFLWIKSLNLDDITSITIHGMHLKKIHDYFETSDMTSEELAMLMKISAQYSDDIYLNKYKTPDSENTHDSVYVRSNYFFANIAPFEKRIISVTIISSSDDVQAFFTTPDEWPSLQTDAYKNEKIKAIMYSRSEKALFNYCCVRNQVECVLNVSATVLDIVSIASADVGLAVADCVVGALNTMASSFGNLFCGNDNIDFEDKFINAMRSNGTTASALTSLLSCFGAGLNVHQKLAKLQGILSKIVVAIDTGANLGNTSCDNFTTMRQPGCPPTSPLGGNAYSINSYDPNDIFGYVAESGSMYVGKEVLNLPYRIEFENDTTFASSAAHTVVVKDTLNAKVFDLASYQPTSFKIGDKDVQLKGDKEFVTTVDMRPEINAIAQVEGLYDAKKGIATWMFTSLDPMTMEPTDDIMQGFLPVNYDGRGIGEVAFNINRKPGLPDGTEIANKASIVFDSNDPILTPVWTNIVDAEPPTSRVCDLEVVSDTIVRVNFEGKDYRSGVWKYALYVQYGKGTSWNQVAETDTTCFDFRYYEDIDYGFCVLATDSAGNVEPKIIEREYMFVNGEATMIDAIAAPQEKKAVTDKAYDLSGRLIQEEGYRGIVIRNRRKLLRR